MTNKRENMGVKLHLAKGNNEKGILIRARSAYQPSPENFDHVSRRRFIMPKWNEFRSNVSLLMSV